MLKSSLRVISVTLTNSKIYPNIASSFDYYNGIPTRLDVSLNGVKSSLLNNQPVLWENFKNLFFHIDPILTAVKKIYYNYILGSNKTL